MNLTGTIALTAGALLIYGAVKNKTPAQIVREFKASGSTGGKVGGSLGGTNIAIPPAGQISRVGN